MSKKKKLTVQEREKLAQEMIEMTAADIDRTLGNLLNPSKKPRESFKTPTEKLSKYHLIVEDLTFWASRQAYLKLIKSFLSKKIDAETFIYKFSGLRIEDMINSDKLCAIIEDGTLPTPDFYYTFKARDFNCLIDEVYLKIEQYDPNLDDWNLDDSDLDEILYSESKLRSEIQKKLLPKLQKSCDLNDSFFRPQVDLD